MKRNPSCLNTQTRHTHVAKKAIHKTIQNRLRLINTKKAKCTHTHTLNYTHTQPKTKTHILLTY